jgi:hypothetical protein
MHTFLLCAPLTVSQTSASCWLLSTRESTCDRSMHAWLAEAARWSRRNPDARALPEISCGEVTGAVSLPKGARWVLETGRMH